MAMKRTWILVVLLLCLFLTACRVEPQVESITIDSPPDGTLYDLGEGVVIKTTMTGAVNAILVRIYADTQRATTSTVPFSDAVIESLTLTHHWEPITIGEFELVAEVIGPDDVVLARSAPVRVMIDDLPDLHSDGGPD